MTGSLLFGLCLLAAVVVWAVALLSLAWHDPCTYSLRQRNYCSDEKEG